MRSDGISKGFSYSNCASTSFAKSIGMEGKGCKGCFFKYIGETGKTLQTRMTQHKAAVRHRYMSYLTTVNYLDTGHQFAFDEAQII